MYWAIDEDLPESGIRKILNRAVSMQNVTRLETGEPNFYPAPHIIDAYHQAALQGLNRYTATEGLPRFRTALAEKLQRVDNVHRTPDEILVTPGGVAGLFLSFIGTLSPGDTVLVPDPGWPDFYSGIRGIHAHFQPYALHAPQYLPDWDELQALITPRTRAIVVNFPGNPAGSIPDARWVQHLIAFAEAHDLWIISDEVYDQIVYDHPATSPAIWAPERTLGVYSFSKTYAMTGWRLGYLSGPREMIKRLTRAAMGIWSSVAEPLQMAGLAAITGPQSVIDNMVSAYRQRRDYVTAQLAHWNIPCSHPDGAFYIIVDISE
ncbi:MAG: aminotransferase class I/II-fold pyridoxal phosphate-dependent enzyme, partial [Firmicutes bacterium]|nr:aminotransferase class I/II-fold pyridoxal phosphate-dependent enzyme [Bacillota bacterium]